MCWLFSSSSVISESYSFCSDACFCKMKSLECGISWRWGYPDILHNEVEPVLSSDSYKSYLSTENFPKDLLCRKSFFLEDLVSFSLVCLSPLPLITLSSSPLPKFSCYALWDVVSFCLQMDTFLSEPKLSVLSNENSLTWFRLLSKYNSIMFGY